MFVAVTVSAPRREPSASPPRTLFPEIRLVAVLLTSDPAIAASKPGSVWDESPFAVIAAVTVDVAARVMSPLLCRTESPMTSTVAVELALRAM